MFGIAVMLVNHKHGEKAELTMRKGSVLFVVILSKQANIQRHKPAPQNAEVQYVGIKGIKRSQSQPVYNMEVDDNHNFAVNGGIIVHNCMDAFRYYVNTARIWKQ